MRVAVVTKHFPHSQQKWGGHSTYQTLRVLSTLCDLHVFYPEASYPGWLRLGPARQTPIDRSWSPEGVAATYVPFSALPVVSRAFNGGSIARRLLPYVADFKPDVLLSYFIYPDGYAAVRIAEMLRVPAVVTAVGSDINRIPDPAVRRLTRYTLRNADFVSTVSQDLCEKVRLLGADRARSRPKWNGCDTSVFHPRDIREARRELGLDIDGRLVAYVGRLDMRKGLIELVEAMAKITRERPDVLCCLIGSGPDEGRVRGAISRHGLEERVKILPPCPTDQVALWMSAADVVTLPSYAEGCPNVVVEALGAGRPVVATNVGGIPELVDESCGRLVAPCDAPSLANALEEVLGRSWNAEEIAATHGRSWQDVAGELYQILADAVRARGALA